MPINSLVSVVCISNNQIPWCIKACTSLLFAKSFQFLAVPVQLNISIAFSIGRPSCFTLFRNRGDIFANVAFHCFNFIGVHEVARLLVIHSCTHRATRRNIIRIFIDYHLQSHCLHEVGRCCCQCVTCKWVRSKVNMEHGRHEKEQYSAMESDWPFTRFDLTVWLYDYMTMFGMCKNIQYP